ncbi:tRNA (guanine-N1)-methyltransferase [Zhouia sp. PK063]|uniref:tRNA (guanine-N1)-methyltransferase n=1 Tax=Zhouia sp. PK063 TaxID=3373602 RepID=UPI0037AC9E05
MIKTKFTTTLLLLFITVLSVKAQENEEDQLSLTNGSIDNQFEYIIQKSNKYQDYKVVKLNWLTLLKRNVHDSVARIENELIESKKLTNNQNQQIADLKKQLGNTNNNLNQVSEEKDSISFFGILIEKNTYKGIMWGIVVLLGAVLAFFVYKFKNANEVTQEAKKSLDELEIEYEEHRRKALEREQKVRRQLQDELNKQKANTK